MSDWMIIVAKVFGGIYPLLEYWLGKTNKVKANSVLELVSNLILGLAKIFKK